MGKDNDAAKLPKIFYVNWFRRGDDGGFLWPGFGENSRVLKWVIERIDGQAAAVETPIGHVPAPGSLDIDGLDLTEERARAGPRGRRRGVEGRAAADPGVVREVRRRPSRSALERARHAEGPPRRLTTRHHADPPSRCPGRRVAACRGRARRVPVPGACWGWCGTILPTGTSVERGVSHALGASMSGSCSRSTPRPSTRRSSTAGGIERLRRAHRRRGVSCTPRSSCSSRSGSWSGATTACTLARRRPGRRPGPGGRSARPAGRGADRGVRPLGAGLQRPLARLAPLTERRRRALHRDPRVADASTTSSQLAGRRRRGGAAHRAAAVPARGQAAQPRRRRRRSRRSSAASGCARSTSTPRDAAPTPASTSLR